MRLRVYFLLGKCRRKCYVGVLQLVLFLLVVVSQETQKTALQGLSLLKSELEEKKSYVLSLQDQIQQQILCPGLCTNTVHDTHSTYLYMIRLHIKDRFRYMKSFVHYARSEEQQYLQAWNAPLLCFSLFDSDTSFLLKQPALQSLERIADTCYVSYVILYIPIRCQSNTAIK